jgi:hypothetical protein
MKTMEIKFRKELRGQELAEVAPELEPTRVNGCYMAKRAYHLGKIERNVVDELQEDFTKRRYGVNRERLDSLWVPGHFGLSVEAKVYDSEGNLTKDVDARQIALDDAGKRTGKVLMGLVEKEIPVYKEIPVVVVEGMVSFERTSGFEGDRGLNDIMKVLDSRGYEHVEIKTPRNDLAAERADRDMNILLMSVNDWN